MWIELFVCSIFLGGSFIIVGLLVSKIFFVGRHSSSPFECGASTFVESRLPFSIPFFILSLVFLVFDMELVILFPYLLCPSSNFVAPLVGLMIFLNFMIISVIFEWLGSVLDWMYFI